MFSFSKRLGIDLGTANSLVYLANQGVVLNEPTVVAVSVDDGKVVAVGNEAREMLGRTPGNIKASRPMREGVIADYEVTEAMLAYFIDKVCGRSRLFKPEVMICVPSGVTQVERRAVLDATMSAGARVAYLIDEPLAAAIGANIPIAGPSGNMIVDIGGGSTETAVISLGGVVVHRSARVAGNKLDEAITVYAKKKYNLLIGERTAEDIKVTIGSAMPVGKARTISKNIIADHEVDHNKSDKTVQNDVKTIESHALKPSEVSPTMEVRGRDALTGLPRTIVLSTDELVEPLNTILSQIVTTVKGVLEETPPELISDIIDKGIVLSGGTSRLLNLDKLMTEATGVPCHVADDPMLCVVKGCGVAIENIDLYRRSITRR